MGQRHLGICASAFSLVELLVAIAILSVLAALLMPALLEGQTQAQTLACAGNMRQFLLGYAAYVTDDRDRIPPHADNWNYAGYGDAGMSFPGALILYDGYIERSIMICPTAPAKVSFWYAGVNPWNDRAGTYDIRWRFFWTNPASLSYLDIPFGTYNYNAGPAFNSGVQPYRTGSWKQMRVSDIRNPSKYAPVWDWDKNRPYGGTNEQNPHARIPGNAYAYFDGHVRFWSADEQRRFVCEASGWNGMQPAGREHVTPFIQPQWIIYNGERSIVCGNTNTASNMNNVVRAVINVPRNLSGY